MVRGLEGSCSAAKPIPLLMFPIVTYLFIFF